MPYDESPETPVTPEQAVARVQAFIDERAASGVLMAEAFTDLELVEGVLTATWSEAAIGERKSEILLEINPFENLAEWLGTPMSFNNEAGRQIRQHVHTVSALGRRQPEHARALPTHYPPAPIGVRMAPHGT